VCQPLSEAFSGAFVKAIFSRPERHFHRFATEDFTLNPNSATSHTPLKPVLICKKTKRQTPQKQRHHKNTVQHGALMT
jgi:hypothetical protein